MNSGDRALASYLVANDRVQRVPDAETFVVDGWRVTLSQSTGSSCTCEVGRHSIACHHLRAAEMVADHPDGLGEVA